LLSHGSNGAYGGRQLFGLGTTQSSQFFSTRPTRRERRFYEA
jgi:hypothetical protein